MSAAHGEAHASHTAPTPKAVAPGPLTPVASPHQNLESQISNLKGEGNSGAAPVALPTPPPGLMTLRVNGTDHFIDPGKYRSLIEALRDLGHDIPHFCYHPGLSLDGNCRMCCVNVLDARSGRPTLAQDVSTQPARLYPKPVVSCREPLNPKGMIVETETPAVREARRWVMEFFLINHPLDCPVCDKAGECLLQDHSYTHGPADSRFLEAKNEKPPKDLGPTIRLWTDRCILCRRCTRFLDEVSGTRELYIVQRGDRCEIDIAPGHPLDNPLMGNVVDICPVGALIDKDLMFTYRAWYLRRTDSLCPACARGCNIQVQAQNEFVRRLVPRENRAVNGWWMCDRGRKDFGYVNAPRRILRARVDGEARPVSAAAEEAGRRLAQAAAADPHAVAALASAWLTVEELHLLATLFGEALKSDQIGLLGEPQGEPIVFPQFRIEGDQNPNRAGARLILGPDAEARTTAILEAARAGRLKALYVASGMPHFAPSAELLEALARVPLLIVQDVLTGPLSEKAHILLPGVSFAEKDGVFVNCQGRAQLLRRAIDPLPEGHDDLTVLELVARGAGAAVAQASSLPDCRQDACATLFSEVAARYPALAGLTHVALGRGGAQLKLDGALGASD